MVLGMAPFNPQPKAYYLDTLKLDMWHHVPCSTGDGYVPQKLLWLHGGAGRAQWWQRGGLPGGGPPKALKPYSLLPDALTFTLHSTFDQCDAATLNYASPAFTLFSVQSIELHAHLFQPHQG